MKKFKALVSSLTLLLTSPAFAFTPMACTFINGFYSGTYQDTSGLFPTQPFPLNMYLVYQNGMIYGYTLKADDGSGAGYGQKPYALIWGECQNNQISNLYVIKNTQTPCGDPASGPMPLTASNIYHLQINYENAMINANLAATLTPNGPSYSLPEDAMANQPLIHQAIVMSQSGIKTCH